MNTVQRPRTVLKVLLALQIAAAMDAYACPNTRIATSPLSIASTEASTIDYQLSSKGNFRVTRTLTDPLPAGTVACNIRLEGRYSRKQSYSRVLTLGTKSSLSQRVAFSARNLPSVNPYVFRKQKIQPVLHLRVVTECIDGSDAVTFSDTTPVVARYADCGSTSRAVTMATFVSRLIRKLSQ